MKKLLAFGALAILPACGGGGSSPSPISTTTTTLPAASRAVVTLGVSNNTFTVTSTTTVSRLLLKCGNFHAEWILTESAGLTAHTTRTDFYLLELDGDIDGRVVNTTTPVQIPARGQGRFVTDRTGCGYMGRDYPATMRGTVDIIDDRGNTQTLTGEIGFTER